MKITSAEEYGLRCVLQLARQGEVSGLTIPELARLEGLSEPYVAKLMRTLRKTGLVVADRGHHGGHRLARRPSDVALGEILSHLDDRLYHPGFCREHAGNEELCVHMRECSIRSVWREVQSAVNGVLNAITLEDLLMRERDLNGKLRRRRPEPLALVKESAHACGTCGPEPAPRVGCGREPDA